MKIRLLQPMPGIEGSEAGDVVECGDQFAAVYYIAAAIAEPADENAPPTSDDGDA